MGKRVLEALGEQGLHDLSDVSEIMQTRAEEAVRNLITPTPNGVYRGELLCDGIDDDTTLVATITITGDSLNVDWTGTTEQVRGGLNCPFTMTLSETCYALRIAMGGRRCRSREPSRPITVTAPEGTILNPAFPAPVMIRVATAHNIAATLFRALNH